MESKSYKFLTVTQDGAGRQVTGIDGDAGREQFAKATSERRVTLLRSVVSLPEDVLQCVRRRGSKVLVLLGHV